GGPVPSAAEKYIAGHCCITVPYRRCRRESILLSSYFNISFVIIQPVLCKKLKKTPEGHEKFSNI
ncbi:MAG: hypothetical protein IJK98_08450, partial [Clostridia bacterium]|nr:hypothetical protein [Clostridia bacterium]